MLRQPHRQRWHLPAASDALEERRDGIERRVEYAKPIGDSLLRVDPMESAHAARKIGLGRFNEQGIVVTHKAMGIPETQD